MQFLNYHRTIEELLTVIEQHGYSQAFDRTVQTLGLFRQSKHGLDELRRALSTQPNNLLTCQECQHLLPSCLTDSGDQTHAAPERAALLLHLALCPDCLAEYTLLRELQDVGTTPVPAFPSPDLAFLEPAWMPIRDWLYQIRFEGRRMMQVALRLAETFTPPSAVMAPALAYKGTPQPGSKGEIVRQVMLTPTETDDLDVEGVVRQIVNDPHHYMLTVRVQVPSRWPDLAGTGVHAQAADWHAEGTTDTDGVVQFTNLPVALVDQLRITISL